jgi:hypothetical protein
MNKKAMMDDLFDFLFTVITLFFSLMFIQVVISGNVQDKQELTLDRLSEFTGSQLMIDYLNSPIEVNGNKMTMQDLIILAVNTGDDNLLKEKSKDLFKKNKLQGTLTVFLGDDAWSGYTNYFSSDVTKNTIELSNLENTNIPLVKLEFKFRT